MESEIGMGDNFTTVSSFNSTTGTTGSISDLTHAFIVICGLASPFFTMFILWLIMVSFKHNRLLYNENVVDPVAPPSRLLPVTVISYGGGDIHVHYGPGDHRVVHPIEGKLATYTLEEVVEEKPKWT